MVCLLIVRTTFESDGRSWLREDWLLLMVKRVLSSSVEIILGQ